MTEPIVYSWIGALHSIAGPVIYFWIGALVAALIVLAIKPIARSRLGNRAMQRLESAAPSLMADIEADMDQLHSEIAVATRRLEISVEQMKAKTTGQLAEIGRSSEALGRLKGDIAEKMGSLSVLQDKEAALGDQLRATEAELAVKASEVLSVERTLADRKAELAKFMSEFNVHPEIAKIRSVHLAEVEGLKADKALVEEQLRQSKQDCMRFKCELDAMGKQVETTWASERMANAVLRERINDVASEVVRVAAALEGLGSPIESLIAAKTEPASSTNGETGQDAALSIEDTREAAKATLVHRIRALRKRSQQLSAPG